VKFNVLSQKMLAAVYVCTDFLHVLNLYLLDDITQRWMKALKLHALKSFTCHCIAWFLFNCSWLSRRRLFSVYSKHRIWK